VIRSVFSDLTTEDDQHFLDYQKDPDYGSRKFLDASFIPTTKNFR